MGENFLPLRYRDSALYSVVNDQTPSDIRSLSQQLDVFVASVKED